MFRNDGYKSDKGTRMLAYVNYLSRARMPMHQSMGMNGVSFSGAWDSCLCLDNPLLHLGVDVSLIIDNFLHNAEKGATWAAVPIDNSTVKLLCCQSRKDGGRMESPFSTGCLHYRKWPPTRRACKSLVPNHAVWYYTRLSNITWWKVKSYKYIQHWWVYIDTSYVVFLYFTMYSLYRVVVCNLTKRYEQPNMSKGKSLCRYLDEKSL